MPIPTEFDQKLAEIDNSASTVLVILRVMNHAPEQSIPRMRAGLREALQEYVNQVMALAPDGD